MSKYDVAENASKYKNSKATAALLNTSLWKELILNSNILENKEDVYVTGGPTLEMWIASWNETYGENGCKLNGEDAKNLVCTIGDYYGYYFDKDGDGKSEIEEYTESPIEVEKGYMDKLYFPQTEAYNNCSGYWLASPSNYNDNELFEVSFVGNIYSEKVYASSTVRPLISLPSNVKLKKIEDGKWIID